MSTTSTPSFFVVGDPDAHRPAGQPSPVVTIVTCTNNRSKAAVALLARILPQIDPAKTAYLIVDSGSNADHAKTLETAVAEYRAKGHPVRLVRSDRSGASRSRNIGLAYAEGEWAAYLHDDAVIGDDWVQSLVDAVTSVPADCAAIGGPIIPLFEGDDSRLSDRWRKLIYPFPVVPGDCTSAPTLTGANLAVRRTVAISMGAHEMTLGRHGNSLMSGEERLLFDRMVANGWRLWLAPGMGVARPVPAERLTEKWAIARMYWEGITICREASLSGRPPRLSQGLQMAGKYLAHSLLSLAPGRRALDSRLSAAWHQGWLREWLTPVSLDGI